MLEETQKSLTIDQVQDLPALVSIYTAAKIFGVHVNTCYGWIDKGEFPIEVIKVNKKTYRIRKTDLLRMLGVEEKPKPKTIDPDKRYRIKSTGEVVLGSELLRRRERK
jgi:hypothetical protein